MQSHGGGGATSKKAKSREVSPRYLSPAPTTPSSSSSTSTIDYHRGSHESPNSTLSPIKQKPDQSRKPKTLEKKSSGFLRGLWPSSSAPKKKAEMLADLIGDERREESKQRRSKAKIERNPPLALGRHRSCTEFRRFGSQRESSKENRNPILGGSMRYLGKFKFSGTSQSSEEDENIMPGRLSVDEVAVRKKSFPKHVSEPEYCDSGSESSDTGPNFDFSPASYMAPTVSSRKHGIDVPSRFMQDRSRRWSDGSKYSSENISNNNNSINNSPKISNLKQGSGGWAGSPGSVRAPLGENKGKVAEKPPMSPSRGKGVRNILNLGIELVTGRKSSSSSSVLGPGSAENVHQLRLLHSGLAQWRFSNARCEVANENYIKECEV